MDFLSEKKLLLHCVCVCVCASLCVYAYSVTNWRVLLHIKNQAQIISCSKIRCVHEQWNSEIRRIFSWVSEYHVCTVSSVVFWNSPWTVGFHFSNIHVLYWHCDVLPVLNTRENCLPDLTCCFTALVPSQGLHTVSGLAKSFCHSLCYLLLHSAPANCRLLQSKDLFAQGEEMNIQRFLGVYCYRKDIFENPPYWTSCLRSKLLIQLGVPVQRKGSDVLSRKL